MMSEAKINIYYISDLGGCKDMQLQKYKAIQKQQLLRAKLFSQVSVQSSALTIYSCFLSKNHLLLFQMMLLYFQLSSESLSLSRSKRETCQKLSRLINLSISTFISSSLLSCVSSSSIERTKLIKGRVRPNKSHTSMNFT